MAKLRKGRIFLAICFLLAAAYGVYYLVWGGSDRGGAPIIITEEARKQNFNDAQKAVQQYQNAKQKGSMEEACAHAKQAFALFGTAGFDKQMYEWVKVVKEECH